jgi:hypothetical protein
MTRSPFSDPNYFVRDGVRAKDVQVKLPSKAPAASGRVPPLETLIERTAEGSFIFSDLPYQGRLLEPVEFSGEPLDGGRTRNFEAWQQYAARHSEGWCVPDAELLYQIAKRLYALRHDALCAPLVDECVRPLGALLMDRSIWTATHVSYLDASDALVHHTATFPGIRGARCAVPEMDMVEAFSYSVVATAQTMGRHGSLPPLTDATKMALQSLFGVGALDAGILFQYVTRRQGHPDREARLWTPPAPVRPCEGGVALYVDGAGMFAINAYSHYDVARPAFGVRPYRGGGTPKVRTRGGAP